MIKQFLPRISLVVGALVVSTVATLAATSPTYAATASAATGLQLSPAVVNLEGVPGKSYVINIKVTNVTTSTLDFTTAINDFGSKDETGTPSILLDPTNKLPTTIQTWVENSPTFTLAPKEEEAVSITAHIPLDAEAGGHYGVIRFTGLPENSNTTNVGLVASAGTLVLVRVAGDIRENLQLSTFTTATTKEKETSLFEVGPLKLIERFTNTGNVHVQPVGQVEISDTFGNHVATLKVNETEGNVLPGSVRRFEQDFNKSWLFGHYTANISIAYGTQGEAIVRTISFWVIPYKLVLLVLLIIITVGYVLVQLIKRYNTYIINRAKQHEKEKSKHKRS